jgi:hypothetical protein
MEDAAARGHVITQVDTKTDNCAPQFKNQYNAMLVASFSEHFPGVRLVHTFAQKDNFKGPHDGHGKRCKQKITKAELTDTRLPDGNAVFHFLLTDEGTGKVEKWMNWEREREQSPKLFESKGDYKNRCAMTESRVIYVSDDKEEYEKMITDEDLKPWVTYCDRESVAPTIGDAAVKGILDCFEFRGERKSVGVSSSGQTLYSLEMSTLPCACDPCLSINDNRGTCLFANLRNTKIINVVDKSKDPAVQEKFKLESGVKGEFKKARYINGKMLKDKLFEKIREQQKTKAPAMIKQIEDAEKKEGKKATRRFYLKKLYYFLNPAEGAQDKEDEEVANDDDDDEEEDEIEGTDQVYEETAEDYDDEIDGNLDV